MPPKTEKKRYQKKDPIDHCLTRSDMYVGSTRLRDIEEYVAEKTDESYNISLQTIKTSPAILRIFVEALSNAIDNVERSRKTKTPCTKIKVYINQETGETSVWNDGDVVPISLDEDEGCYIHSMIFGQLLTGSNYDDEEERIVSGRNGLGIKLTNIFSTKFTVTGCDPTEGKILTQEWKNNMRDTQGPNIKATKLKKGYTQVTWVPDFPRFELKNYTDDIVKLYTRYIVDAAMLSKVKVYLNDELIPVKSLSDYSLLYNSPTNEKLYIKTNTSEVVITPSNSFQAVSFVNGVYTRLGGRHVESWSEALLRPIVDSFNGKGKKTKKTKKKTTSKINITDVKQFFRIFIVSTVIRPEFDSQDKCKLESPNVEAEVKKNHISAIMKWSVIDNIEQIIRAKELVVLKKVEQTSKRAVIDNYDRANKSGTKESINCSLFVVEGLSAKTYVVAGINKGVYGRKGRDWNGVLPLRGKLLNVRDKSAVTIASSKTVMFLIQALGLKHDVDYTQDVNFKKLNYGRLVIVTDADQDGIHIEGLIMNFIHSLYPSLLDRETPFIVSLKTPIVKVTKNGKDIMFYDERNFKNWLKQQTGKINAKYFKGLGTTRAADVSDAFGNKIVEYSNDENSFHNMQKLFHKKYSNKRKEWLAEYDPEKESIFSLDKTGPVCKMNITDFINNELVKYSYADCARNIPNGIDGLKESQRKILYAVKKRKLKYSGKTLKVAQLAGYTAEHSNYHHGEQNLFKTITNMANEFPGTNNIPLLYRDGMFGTRLDGGEDASDARYIFTKMEALTELLFREEDDPILTPVNDDGDLIQPEFYIPILPMILINGCTAGIGTGWSCNIPCFNPKDMIAAVKTWIENDGEVLIEDPDNELSVISMFPDFIPWYRGFKGDIIRQTQSRYITYGIAEEIKKNTVKISELPIGMWTKKFVNFCEELQADKKLKVDNYSIVNDVNVILTENGSFECDLDTLKLHSYLFTSNMVVFDENRQLKKFDTVDELVAKFCEIRYEYYVKRKQYQLNALEKELCYLGNKVRFVREVVNKELKIMKVKEPIIVEELKKRGYDEDPKGEGYGYLLSMQVRTFTHEKIEKMENDIDTLSKKVEILKNTDEKDIWLKEIEEFDAAYDKWLVTMEEEEEKQRNLDVKEKSGRRKGKK